MTNDNSVNELVYRVSLNNPQAYYLLVKVSKEINAKAYLATLASYNIKGAKLLKFYDQSCDNDYDKFIFTLELMFDEVFDREDININMSLETFIPLVNDDLASKHANEILLQGGYSSLFVELLSSDFSNRISQYKVNSFDESYDEARNRG